VREFVRVFVTDKLSTFTFCLHRQFGMILSVLKYREYRDLQFVRINCILGSYSLRKVLNRISGS